MNRIINKLNPDHPRLLATAQDFARIRGMIETNELYRGWWESLRKQADEIPAGGIERGNTAVGYLWAARELRRRVMLLGLAYQITGDTAYAQKAYDQMVIVCGKDTNGFTDWDTEHFLDTAETMTAIAYGYDWIYDYLNAQQRGTLKNALVERGLAPAKATYAWYFDQQEEPPYELKPFIRNGWVNCDNNWSCVCNGGVTVAALCIGDEEPDLCNYCIECAVRSVVPAVGAFGPEGSCAEGRAYWGYAMRYFCEMLGSMETALGTTFGLHDFPGIADTWQFPFHITGNSGFVFNFSDSGTECNRESTVAEFFYFANKFGIKGLGNERVRSLIGTNDLPNPCFPGGAMDNEPCRIAVNTASKKVEVKDLLWCKKAEYLDCTLPLAIDRDQYYSVDSIVTMRQDKEEDALFVAIKGGDNNVNHGDLDSGSFVLDALGERWICDLGADTYSLPGYFEDDPDGCRRWGYYRKRAEGHNTLVIGPDMLPDQVQQSVSSFCDVQINCDAPYAVCDLTDAYKRNGATSVKRTAKLLQQRTVFALQDSIVLDAPSEVWWFAHTKAEITLSVDGRTAMLHLGEKHLEVTLHTPVDTRFAVHKAEPLPQCPNLPGQLSNKDYRKLAIRLQNVTAAEFKVTFTPKLGDTLTKEGT